MGSFKLIKDKDLIYDVMDYDVVLVGANIMNTQGNGFQHKVCRSFPFVRKANEKTRYGDPKKLGTVVVAQEEGTPKFCICYIFKGRYRPDRFPDVVEYDYMRKCLKLVNKNFKGLKVGCTVLGHSPFEGGGDYDRCLNMLKEELVDVDLTVYDYEQINYRDEDNHNYKAITEAREKGEIDVEEYYRRKLKFAWEKRHGLYTPIPDTTYKRMICNFRKNRRNDLDY